MKYSELEVDIAHFLWVCVCAESCLSSCSRFICV